MPGRDGTGPLGLGPMSGRGAGFCSGINIGGYGAGRRFGRGYGLGWRYGLGIGVLSDASPAIPKEMLAYQKKVLQKHQELIEEQIKAIDKRLEDLE